MLLEVFYLKFINFFIKIKLKGNGHLSIKFAFIILFMANSVALTISAALLKDWRVQMVYVDVPIQSSKLPCLLVFSYFKIIFICILNFFLKDIGTIIYSYARRRR